jgi:ABC-2 type transport system permease protein
LGVLISTRAPNQQVAMILSMLVLLLPTMMLSGFIFPISSMPRILQVISHIIPAKYFIEIEKAVMLKGAGLEVVLHPVIILFVMFFVFLILARRNFKVIYK